MEGHFSSLNRERILSKMHQSQFDLIVIGGGITGAGIALDAVSRGMKTALIEMQDFAASTSSRSSKVIDGGLMHLSNYKFKLVSESAHERHLLYENSPNVIKQDWMLMPIYKGAKYGRAAMSVGLHLYNFLAKVKKSEKSIMLSKEEALRYEPKLKREGLVGAAMIAEYRTDDARLTLEILKEAEKLGAQVINYTKAVNLIYENKRVTGIEACDMMTGKTYQLFGRKVINAAGPWVDQLREIDQSLDRKRLQLTKGIHLVFSQQTFPLKQSIYFMGPAGQMIMVIPRGDKTYVGTTNTPFEGELTTPIVTAEDKELLIGILHSYFPELKLTMDDIVSSWAAVRPLLIDQEAGPVADDFIESRSGLLSITRGRISGYRKLSEICVDVIASRLKTEHRLLFSTCRTKNLPISGGHIRGTSQYKDYVKRKVNEGVNLGLSKNDAYMLAATYGSNIDHLYHILQESGESAKKYQLPKSLFAQVKYAILYEFAYTPLDFFYRRTRALLFDPEWVRKWKAPVIELMSDLIGWSKEQKAQFQEELDRELSRNIQLDEKKLAR